MNKGISIAVGVLVVLLALPLVSKMLSPSDSVKRKAYEASKEILSIHIPNSDSLEFPPYENQVSGRPWGPVTVKGSVSGTKEDGTPVTYQYQMRIEDAGDPFEGKPGVISSTVRAWNVLSGSIEGGGFSETLGSTSYTPGGTVNYGRQ